MSAVVDRMLTHWRTESACQPGAPAADLDAFERKHRVRLPEAFRALYSISNGCKEPPDDRLITFWPIDRMEPASVPDDTQPTRRLFVFADFLIDSHWYAVDLGDESGPVCVVGYQVVAHSFEEFLVRYLDGPELSLHPHPRAAPAHR